jgi:malate dehydrogenase (oxaloacetate-decarboxylating)
MKKPKTFENAISLQRELQGKIEIKSKVHLNSRKNLSLAYTPGVGQVATYIHNNKHLVYDMTIKHNTVAVVTDGSAVLGLGNLGPEAALPVMEGKCAIFKEFAGINAFPICLNTQDPQEVVNAIRAISPVFGAINIEDISAPRCFEIEEQLQDLGIPVIHDDQHATAIVILAALTNALKIVKKTLANAKIVVNGSGAAGTAIINLLVKAGAKNIIAVDRKGIISPSREDVSGYKIKLAQITNPQKLNGSLADAAKGADALIGVSAKGAFTQPIIQSMNPNPIVFALANPDPEVSYADAKRWGVKVIATGRSDYPNQVNNALVFPGLFKGLLVARKTKVTDEIKFKAAYAIASLVKNPTPHKFIPSIFEKEIVPTLIKAVCDTP